MSPQRFWAAAAVLPVLLVSSWPPTEVDAQVAGSGASSLFGGIQVDVASVGGVSRDELGPLYLGIKECRADVPIAFRLDGAPTNKPVVDIYRGENCNKAGRADTSENLCEYIATAPGGIGSNLSVVLNAQALIQGGCEGGLEGTPKLWFLPVNEAKSAETVSTYGVFVDLENDMRPPAALDISGGGSAEKVIAVSWTIPERETKIERFVIYIDPAPEGGGSAIDASVQGDADGGTSNQPGAINPQCPSSILLPGLPAPETTPEGIRSETVNTGTATKAQIRPDGTEGAQVAISVVAEDKAGNRSPFSEVICAQFQPTQDFWEAYQQAGGTAAEGCPCRANGSAQLQNGLPVALAFLLLLGLSARRRTAR
jgi:hypothetical protein